MNIRRVVPDICSNRLAESREFYAGLLGMTVAMDMGWIITLVSPSNPTAQISILKHDPPLPPPGKHMALTIEVENVDEMHERAVAKGATISYPLTDEPWGVRRFFLVDPNGITVNVMNHIKKA